MSAAGAWAVFERAANRPDSIPAILSPYGLQWECFILWLSEKYPDTKLLRDTTEDAAGEYAAQDCPED